MASELAIRRNWGRGNHALRPVLDTWSDLVTGYLDSEWETPFNHTEAANNSLLCAAAYKNDWVGICELVVARDKGTNSVGRCDVYLSNESKGFLIETKQLWHASSSKNFTKENLGKLKQAEKQAKDLPDYRKDQDYRRFAGAYVIPAFSKTADFSVDDITDCFTRCTDLLNARGYGLGTWLFINPAADINVDLGSYRRRPGVIFGLKEIL